MLEIMPLNMPFENIRDPPIRDRSRKLLEPFLHNAMGFTTEHIMDFTLP